ncbi:hypothetical protein HDU76_000702 [Blyttiomyces sp. JEL0837]|nr:hypothetical protein HDU76_000702 [Blyttiomyces sp. JEL0837]
MIGPSTPTLTMTVLAIVALMTQPAVAQLPTGIITNDPQCAAAAQKISTDTNACIQAAGTDPVKIAGCICTTDYYNSYKYLATSCTAGTISSAEVQQLLNELSDACAKNGTPISGIGSGGSGLGTTTGSGSSGSTTSSAPAGTGSTSAPVGSSTTTPAGNNKSGANSVGTDLTLVASAAGAIVALFL